MGGGGGDGRGARAFERHRLFELPPSLRKNANASIADASIGCDDDADGASVGIASMLRGTVRLLLPAAFPFFFAAGVFWSVFSALVAL
jgi:hypothetical protein